MCKLECKFIQIKNTHVQLHIWTLAVSGNADSFVLLVQIVTSTDIEGVNGPTHRKVYQDSINTLV